MVEALEALIGFFSLLAAAFWMVGAFVSIPALAADVSVATFLAALGRQAKWYRLAASCAGLAAFTQVFELIAVHAGVSIGPLSVG